MPSVAEERSTFVEHAFWIVLGRAPSGDELGAALRGFHEGSKPNLLVRLLTSEEAVRARAQWARGGDALPDLERGLRTTGSDREFVERLYEWLLGRPADDSGRHHYIGALAAGDSRVNALRAFARSDEFARRIAILSRTGVIPRDVQLCELANPAKWDNPEWVEILGSLGLARDKGSMHRKPYELAQLIFGCQRLGVLTSAASVVSIGAGHELVLYWLANHVRYVVATDLYGGAFEEAQGREGDPRVVEDPDVYAPFPYRRDRLRFLKMDGRRLAFGDGAFDIAYSLSSIEHFGGMDGAAATIREMARVLRPGGVLALATEYVLSGPPHEETFRPDEVHALLRQSGLELVQPIDERVFERYDHSVVDLYGNPYETPHMVVRFNDTIFTTVMVFLRKV